MQNLEPLHGLDSSLDVGQGLANRKQKVMFEYWLQSVLYSNPKSSLPQRNGIFLGEMHRRMSHEEEQKGSYG